MQCRLSRIRDESAAIMWSSGTMANGVTINTWNIPAGTRQVNRDYGSGSHIFQVSDLVVANNIMKRAIQPKIYATEN